jgi:hypothetical protein
MRRYEDFCQIQYEDFMFEIKLNMSVVVWHGLQKCYSYLHMHFTNIISQGKFKRCHMEEESWIDNHYY